MWRIGLILIGLRFLLYKNKSVKKPPAGEQVELVANDAEEQLIKQLHPLIRSKAVQFLELAKQKNITLKIVEGRRSFSRQTKLYNQGRTTPGKIVTNAKAGHSYHNYGLAFDVIPVINGKATYKTTLWPVIGEIGKSLGLEWGGDWKGNLVDRPHFQITNGYTTSQLVLLYLNGKVDENGFIEMA